MNSNRVIITVSSHRNHNFFLKKKNAAPGQRYQMNSYRLDTF